MGQRTRAKTVRKTREPLTRPRILECALALIDRDGLDALSMRKLGSELGVEAMSLYNHVPNKEALLEGVTETMLGEVDLRPVEGDDWASAIRAAALSFRDVLLAHPNAIPLIASKPEVSPQGFYPVELSLGILKQAGLAPADMLMAHWLVVGYVMGHVAFQIASPLGNPETAAAEVERRRKMLSEEEFPNFFEILPHAEACDWDQAFLFGLDTILTGLSERLRRPQT